jgi:hypothetical protein
LSQKGLTLSIDSFSSSSLFYCSFTKKLSSFPYRNKAIRTFSVAVRPVTYNQDKYPKAGLHKKPDSDTYRSVYSPSN